MASLVLKMSVSLDGFAAPIDGSTQWVAAGRSDDGASWTVETLSNAGAHLVGATTYAAWAGFCEFPAEASRALRRLVAKGVLTQRETLDPIRGMACGTKTYEPAEGIASLAAQPRLRAVRPLR